LPAEGNSDLTETDMKYYRLLEAWHDHEDIEFSLVNSHDKASAVRDSSKHETLRRSLMERLRNSRNMVLIIGDTTRLDADWMPFEIAQAIDTYEIPIIAAYPAYLYIRNPAALRSFWPAALAHRIDNGTAHVIHIPFRQGPIKHAVKQFDHNNYPLGGGLGFYSWESYVAWGLVQSSA
jgi:antiphage defense system Thoeris ThsB-like protein